MRYLYIPLPLNLRNPTGKLLVYLHPYMSINGKVFNVYEDKFLREILNKEEMKQHTKWGCYIMSSFIIVPFYILIIRCLYQ
jgi:hypothetical protein